MPSEGNERIDPLGVNPGNIENFRQNRLKLVAEDLYWAFQVPTESSLRILLARGVGNWLRVRYELIRLKDAWKVRVRESLERQSELKREVHGRSESDWLERTRREHYEKGYRKGIEECRAEVRALCHSRRWAWPPRDNQFVKRNLKRSKEVEFRAEDGKPDLVEP